MGRDFRGSLGMHPVQVQGVFLDRDGVLNRSLYRNGRPYAPVLLEEFEIFPEAGPALSRLKARGFKLVVVTNQPDVGKGLVPREVVEAMHRRLAGELPLDAIKVSYGTREDDPFRKPNPGMLLEAAGELGIDLARSFMVGDRWRDIDAGRAAGCRTILIGDGYGEVGHIDCDHRCGSIAEAVAHILGCN